MSDIQILKQLISRYPGLSGLEQAIKNAAEAIVTACKNGGKVLVCGNGGSSADSGHIVGELMKSFKMERPLDINLKEKLKDLSRERGILLANMLQQGFPTISLSAHTALLTAISNDIGGEAIFAQQVVGYGNEGDILMAISSSGNSANVTDALIVGKAKGLKTIGMTGKDGGIMKKYCDVLINVPGEDTATVQELHLPVYHAVCLMVEKKMLKKQ